MISSKAVTGLKTEWPAVVALAFSEGLPITIQYSLTAEGGQCRSR